ncbi:MAG: hypothetical protein EPO12_13690 [Aquabacterium sp.]|nr:MAG: hypothetical protein EPO12_13690 [Aquabacterium sp.]
MSDPAPQVPDAHGLVWTGDARALPPQMLGLPASLPADLPCAAVGWLRAPGTEGGVPAAVRRSLARGLCALGWVVFPTDHETPDDGGWHVLDDGSAVGIAAAAGWRRRRTAWCATRVPERAAGLFDTAGHDWTQGAQRALVCSAQPALDATLAAVLADTGEAPSPARALVLPGADGEFAAFCFFDPAAQPQLAQALEQACRAQGLGWRTADAEGFGRCDWIADPHAPQTRTGDLR